MTKERSRRKLSAENQIIALLFSRKIEQASKKASEEQDEKLGPRRRIAEGLARLIREEQHRKNGNALKHAFENGVKLGHYCWDTAKEIVEATGLR